MALSRARYDDVVIPFARRSSILEDAAVDRLSRRASLEIQRRISLPGQRPGSGWLPSLSSTKDFRLEPIGDDNAFYEERATKLHGVAEERSKDGEEEEEIEEEEFLQEDFEDLPAPPHPNFLARISGKARELLFNFVASRKRVLRTLLLICFAVLYIAYFCYAMYVERLRNENSIRLLWVTCATVLFIVIHFVKSCKGPVIAAFFNHKIVEPWRQLNSQHKEWPNKIVFM